MSFLDFIASYWWVLLILGGALVSGIVRLTQASRGEVPSSSAEWHGASAERPAAASAGVQDGDDVATLRAWAEQNAATMTRLQDQVDQLSARLDRVEGILRDVD